MTNLTEAITAYWDNPRFAGLEHEIARRCNTRRSPKRYATTAQLIARDLSCAEIDWETLVEFIDANYDRVLEFGVALLSDRETSSDEQEYAAGEEPDPEDQFGFLHQGLAEGCSTQYGMWLYYLDHRTRTELDEFNKRLRVPYAKKHAAALRRLYQVLKPV